jgi:hypothetical protein
MRVEIQAANPSSSVMKFIEFLLLLKLAEMYFNDHFRKLKNCEAGARDDEQLLKISGFLPRVRARALRAPVLFGSFTRPTGRCKPPTHRSFATPSKI